MLWIMTRFFAPRPGGSVVVRTNYGFKMVVDPVVDRVVEDHIYYHGTYEAGTLDVMTTCLREGDAFVDVGSNVGLMSLLASRMVGDHGIVYSFEPEPKTFAILMENIELNGITNIRAHNLAMGMSAGVLPIHYNLHIGRGSSSLMRTSRSVGGPDVEIDSLGEFFARNGVESVRMMKIDVEGWELEVLKGAREFLRSGRAPILCLECSQYNPFPNGTVSDLYTFVRSVNDYRVYKLEQGSLRVGRLVEIADGEDLPQHDNIFCLLPAHLSTVEATLFR